MNELFQDMFIFEMANNHQGSVEHGLKIIREMGAIARNHSVRAGLKFQFRDLDTFIHPEARNQADVKHIPRFLSTALTRAQFRELSVAVRDEGLVPIATPFDEKSVDMCHELGIQVLKVASASADDWPLLDAIASAGLPVIASTGGLKIDEIDRLVSFLTHRNVDFAILHCVSVYPTPTDMINLNFMERLMKRYPRIPIGYSGHEAPDDTDVVKGAVAKGARILERHVGVETDSIKLNKYSMNPVQVDAWVGAAVKAMKIAGISGANKDIEQVEIDELLSLKRGVYAAQRIIKGEVIKREDVYFAMPCSSGQISSGEFGQYRTTWIASANYEPDDPICESKQNDPIADVRAIIHDAKGMLYEAGIVIGNQFEIELSHHYGLNRFREVGAILISLVNRQYCKKLVIMLPKQSHPVHKHKIKEETFQLLWGDLRLDLNGITQLMKPGDMSLVKPDVWHSFSSIGGAIFEEISTTHIKGDSYYQDPEIQSSDPILRKTILEDW